MFQNGHVEYEDFRLDKVSQIIQKQLQLDLASREHWYVSGTMDT